MTIGEIINWLRVANVVALVLTMILLARPAFRAWTKDVQPRDVIWMALWFDALNRSWFIARSIHFGDSGFMPWEAEILAACYVFAIAIQAVVIRAYRWGRT